MPDPSNDIADRVRRLIARELGVDLDKVVDTARLDDDLAADHIDIVTIVMEIEDEFGVALSEDQLEHIGGNTVAFTIALVTALSAPAAQAA